MTLFIVGEYIKNQFLYSIKPKNFRSPKNPTETGQNETNKNCTDFYRMQSDETTI